MEKETSEIIETLHLILEKMATKDDLAEIRPPWIDCRAKCRQAFVTFNPKSSTSGNGWTL